MGQSAWFFEIYLFRPVLGCPDGGGGDQGPGTKTRDIGTREKATQIRNLNHRMLR